MDKKKVSIIKDGRKTTIQNRSGSSYKKISKLQTVKTDMTDMTLDEKIPIFNEINHSYDVESHLDGYDKTIKNFLSSLDIDIEDEWLIGTLKREYIDHKGVAQAASCLFEIQCTRSYFKAGEYKKACANLARLVGAYNKFYFAIIESTVSLGASRQDGLRAHKKKTKLTVNQLLSCFNKFESLNMNTDKSRKLNKGEKWVKVIKFVKEEYGITISDRPLRDKYKLWKSR